MDTPIWLILPVIQFGLLFGTTWFVNSLVLAGVLLAVYLAVETARPVRLPRSAVLYGLAFLTILRGGPHPCPPNQQSLPRPELGARQRVRYEP